MRKGQYLIVSAALASLCVGVSLAQVRNSGPARVPSPAKWVAFSADLLSIRPGSPPARGKFYRNSDGSERVESQSVGPDGQVVSVINIKNIPQSTFYLFRSPIGWTEHPMILPPQGWRPETRLAKADYVRLAERIQGFEVYRRSTTDGLEYVEAPALNFFHLARETGPGYREVYTNVQIGEPSPDLFRPPAGSTVTISPIPTGIVTRFRKER